MVAKALSLSCDLIFNRVSEWASHCFAFQDLLSSEFSSKFYQIPIYSKIYITKAKKCTLELPPVMASKQILESSNVHLINHYAYRL